MARKIPLMDNLQVLLNVLPVYQSLIFSGLAFMMYLRGEGYHRLTLGLFMLGNALLFAVQGLWNLNVAWGRLPAFVLSLPIWLLQLPLFYLFLKSVLQPDYVISSKDFKHLIPALAGLLLMLLFLWQPPELREAYLAGEKPQNPGLKIFRMLFWLSVYGGIYVQFFIYLWYAYRRYPEYLRNILNYYSNPEHYSLSWLRWMLFLFILFYLMFDIFHLINVQSGTLLSNEFTLMMIFLNFSMGFFGLSQPDTWFEHRRKQSENVNPIGAETTPIVQGIDKITNNREESIASGTTTTDEYSLARVEEIILRAEKLMLEQKPWANPEFNIADLSAMLGVNSKYVSRAINSSTGMSFSQWVNLFRIREAEKLLLSDSARQFSMEGIYSQCGFTNKNTFLNAFRKVHGMTPSQYRQRKLESEKGI